MRPQDEMPNTVAMYRFFADESRETSPSYGMLADAVSEDAELLGVIATLPTAKQQPNLIFASAKYLGAEMSSVPAFRQWLLQHWHDLAELAMRRATQTNEVGRLGVIMPALAQAQAAGPIALLELGSSAGLCLFPDRYSYRYNGEVKLHPKDGPSPVLIETAVQGSVPLPESLPEIAWRGGIDLNPLSAADSEDADWLRALVWPEQTERLLRLNAALAVTAELKYHSFRGDFLELLPEALATIPSGLTPVLFHSAAVAYLPRDRRQQLADTVAALGVHWVSFEGQQVIPGVTAPALGQPHTDFLLSVNRIPQAFSKPHGASAVWL